MLHLGKMLKNILYTEWKVVLNSNGIRLKIHQLGRLRPLMMVETKFCEALWKSSELTQTCIAIGCGSRTTRTLISRNLIEMQSHKLQPQSARSIS